MRRLAAFLALATAAVACGAPPEPETPPQPPEDGSTTCSDVCVTAERLGGCGLPLGTCLDDCLGADKAERELGGGLPLVCMATASDCDAFNRCNR